jgi:hypothetical protein
MMENMLVPTKLVRPHAQLQTTAFLINQQIALQTRKHILLANFETSQINGNVSLVLPAILALTK